MGNGFFSQGCDNEDDEHVWSLTSLLIHRVCPKLKAFSLPSSLTSTCWYIPSATCKHHIAKLEYRILDILSGFFHLCLYFIVLPTSVVLIFLPSKWRWDDSLPCCWVGWSGLPGPRSPSFSQPGWNWCCGSWGGRSHALYTLQTEKTMSLRQ